jgi:hypothetical protein
MLWHIETQNRELDYLAIGATSHHLPPGPPVGAPNDRGTSAFHQKDEASYLILFCLQKMLMPQNISS